MSDALKTFRENNMFTIIFYAREEKFQKHCKDIPHLFIFAVVLDPTIKIVSAKLLADGITENLLTRLDINFATLMFFMNELFVSLKGYT